MTRLRDDIPPLVEGDLLATATSLPPLRDGELLDQPEFHARYCEMPDDFRAELLEGKVQIVSPAFNDHARPHGIIIQWLGNYATATPGVESNPECTLILGNKNEVQPDGVLFIEASHGGRMRFSKRGAMLRPPELIVEVADATERRDQDLKRKIYEREGVQEFILILVRSRKVLWFHREVSESAFIELVAENGILKSRQFPGLWLDPEALLDKNRGSVDKVLRKGLRDPAHARFVRELAARKKTGGLES